MGDGIQSNGGISSNSLSALLPGRRRLAPLPKDQCPGPALRRAARGRRRRQEGNGHGIRDQGARMVVADWRWLEREELLQNSVVVLAARPAIRGWDRGRGRRATGDVTVVGRVWSIQGCTRRVAVGLPAVADGGTASSAAMPPDKRFTSNKKKNILNHCLFRKSPPTINCDSIFFCI